MTGGDDTIKGGRKVKKATVKQLKKMLKNAGLKTSGKRAALTRRAKKAHLKIRGGGNGSVVEGAATVGGRRRSRRSRGFKLF